MAIRFVYIFACTLKEWCSFTTLHNINCLFGHEVGSLIWGNRRRAFKYVAWKYFYVCFFVLLLLLFTCLVLNSEFCYKKNNVFITFVMLFCPRLCTLHKCVANCHLTNKVCINPYQLILTPNGDPFIVTCLVSFTAWSAKMS